MITVEDEKEIVRQYKEAKDPKGMILILSQLNACSREEIVLILQKYGIEDPRMQVKPKTVNKTPVITSAEKKVPDSVRKLLQERMKELKCQIKELEKEHNEIAEYLYS